MLAGDLLPGRTRSSRSIATGFHRNTTTNTEGGANAEEYRFASVVDRVNTTMQVWMGTTFGCAQCHNHKYDPFTQKEYYQLFAIFNNTADANSEEPSLEVPRVGREAEFATLVGRLAEAKRRLEEETKRVDVATAGVGEDRRSVASCPRTIAEVLAVPAEKRSRPQADALAAHHRSSSPGWSARDAEVKRLAGRARSGLHDDARHEGSRRAADARGDPGRVSEPGRAGHAGRSRRAPPGRVREPSSIASAWPGGSSTPPTRSTARVAVNRLWQEIFGIGIVETSEEFGTQGEPPSHPELLDWLATEYIRLGWDTKRLLKLIVTSATYRQSSRVSDELARRDPYNRLLARGPRVRLPAEALRDQALAVSGLLSPKMYGPPVHPFQPVNGLAAAFGPSTDWETSRGEDRSPPRPLHALAAEPAVSVDDRVRRARARRLQHATGPHEHADPGPGHAQRPGLRRGRAGAGPPDPAGGGDDRRVARRPSAFRVVLSRPPTEAESRRLVGSVSIRADLARRRSGPCGRAGDQADRAAPDRDGCRRCRRLDGRRQRAPEPRRDPCQATMSRIRRRTRTDDPPDSLDRLANQTRRHFLREGSLGLGGLALAGCSAETASRAGHRGRRTRSRPGRRTSRPRSRTSSSCSMSGGPPHLDLFDYKPELVKRNGQDCPASLTKGKPFAFTGGHAQAAGHAAEVRASTARAGAWVSAALPRLAAIADDLTFIKSMYTDQFNHGPAELLLLTGIPRTAGRPSLGSWVTYGLGSESRDLPGFIVFVSGGVAAERRQERLGQRLPAVGLPGRAVPHRRRSGALPLRPRGDGPRAAPRSASTPSATSTSSRPSELGHPRDGHADRPVRAGLPHAGRRARSDGHLARAGRHARATTAPSPARRASPTTACSPAAWSRRACASCSSSTGAGTSTAPARARTSATDLSDRCAAMDRPVAALIRDLKRRGLLDETLVVWMGEFGRTPFREGRTAASPYLGRDHHPFSNTLFMAGGGLKPGFTFGATDELGFHVDRGPRPRPRHPGDDPAPAGLRPHQAHLPLPGPRLPPDRRPRRGGQGDPRLNRPRSRT